MMHAIWFLEDQEQPHVPLQIQIYGTQGKQFDLQIEVWKVIERYPEVAK